MAAAAQPATGKEPSAPPWATPSKVPIDRIEAELLRAWATAGPSGKQLTRVQTMSLVALCETTEHVSDARAALGAAGSQHGARTVEVVWIEGQTPTISAQIALHPRVGKPDVPGGEEIRIEAVGAAREWIPDTISRLLSSDLPVYAWWVGDLPDDDRLFDRVAALSSLAIFNSNDMDLRDLQVLDRLASSDDRYVVSDLSWHRLRTWQEFTARFFDDPRCAPALREIDEVAIRFTPRVDAARTADPMSNLAALYAGWIAHALKWKLRGWDEKATTATVDRAGGTVTLRFVPETRANVPPGTIVGVDWKGRGTEMKVERDARDPLVICWSGTRDEVMLPAQCVRVSYPTPARTLGRALERPVRDPLFEASLHMAATLVAAIAPKAPAGPTAAATKK